MKFLLKDAAETEALGRRLAAALRHRAGLVIYLTGNLGAGKTTLARGFLRALGVTGAIRSPTYTLLEPYEFDVRSLIHMDLYRLNDPLELENLGLRDFPPAQTWWLVEWPERGVGKLPPADVQVQLVVEGDGRKCEIHSLADIKFGDGLNPKP